MSSISQHRLSLAQTLNLQRRILVALMLRDVKTRFFGHPLGFIIAVGWPLANIFIVLLINTGLGRAVPYGNSAALWYGSGLVPFMAFQYMSRFTVLGIVANRQLLRLPLVKVMDVLLARALLEVLNAGVGVVATLLIFTGFGIDFMPFDPVQAFCAMGASMLLGLSFGIVNGVMAGVFAPWATGYGLFGIVMWIASGVLFVPDDLPETARYWLSFNPALQGAEWMRSAYYEGYGTGVLDKTYMLTFALTSLFLGLVLERFVRGRILQ
jgi:capsular polysaccharide transport system permease protein